MCVCEDGSNGGDDGDVVFVVDYVFLDVVICCCCDGGSHGEVLLLFVLVAGWSVVVVLFLKARRKSVQNVNKALRECI